MKYLFFFLFTVSQLAFAQDNCKSFKSSWPLKRQQVPNINYNARSDTFDILHYDITLDLTNTGSKKLKGICSIDFKQLIDNNTLTLDLQGLSTDSVVWLGYGLLNHSGSGTQIKIDISAVSNLTDTNTVIIYYGGTPVTDPSGFGGFYFESGYAYNLGVAFSDNPHNFGRVWHPCFDNFIERASYDYHIKTANGYSGYANGILNNEEIIGGDTIIRHWSIAQDIPTYLASVAASTYSTVHQNITTKFGDYPTELVAKPADTSSLKKSFIHLPETFNSFEKAFGKYQWDKVGYNLTTRGAMEHPGAISYPLSIVDGTTAYENIMAHELAHHWWGNLVTCETAEDMWINEGFAEYCSHLFLEDVYNKERYINAVEANHFDVLRTAHISDGSFLPISGIPHENTYGTHVYNKGASVAHNLRTYLGDSTFFATMTAFLDENKFKHVNSLMFRDFINANTNISVVSFFEDWVFNPGFPHFEIDSVIKTPNHPTQWEVSIEQKVYHAPDYFETVPLSITFMNKAGEKQTDTILTSSWRFTHYFDLSFEPDWVVLNYNNEMTLAIYENELMVTSVGTHSFPDAGLNLNISDIGADSALIRVEQHLVAPDPIKNNTNNYRLSTSRYWTIEGFIEAGFKASTSITYNSRGNYPPDGNLAKITEDSLLLMYRRDASADWTEYWNYEKNIMGSSTNGSGRVSINKVLPGQYTFANGVSSIGITEQISSDKIEIFPNPSSNFIHIDGLNAGQIIELFDIQGRNVLHKIASNSSELIDISKFPPGTYLFKSESFNQKIEVIH